MYKTKKISVIIPAYNEEQSIAKVLEAIPSWVDEIIVVDNGSTDKTSEIAGKNGARTILEPRKGYGSACLAGIACLSNPDVVVFLDADYSDYPEEMHLLVDPIVDDKSDLVIGSRMTGQREQGALTPQAKFGNWLSTSLIRLIWKEKFTDLGPFRAIKFFTLKQLAMRDTNFGWTVEMQIKAAILGCRTAEVPVRYRPRIGQSKISYTVKGVISAGVKILYTIFYYAFKPLVTVQDDVINNHISIFTRYPEEGKTKTRLIPALGAKGASELQKKMTVHVMKRVRQFADSYPVSPQIQYEGGNNSLMKEWLGPGLEYSPQSGHDLGEKMANAFIEGFQNNFERVVIIGTDCPQLGTHHIESAFNALRVRDLVFGPAQDGGYYLIGLKKPDSMAVVPKLFENIEWVHSVLLNCSP